MIHRFNMIMLNLSVQEYIHVFQSEHRSPWRDDTFSPKLLVQWRPMT
jgi:hypothetical protein